MTLSTEFYTSWKAPSNIALIKYWGKKDIQLPRNPSLGLTLHSCYTQTKLFVDRKNHRPEFFYKGRQKDEFLPKINTFLTRIAPHCPPILQRGLRIHSTNTFPHSSGIASSASFFASLSLCLMSYLRHTDKKKSIETQDDFLREASFLARLGSGSACRSVFPFASLWGKTKYGETSDEYAVPFKLTEIFKHYRDSIIIVSQQKKEIPSSKGHSLMEGHPYGLSRYEEAGRKLLHLIEAMKTNDLTTFCELIETEALELHGLMMSSKKSFILMSPETLDIIIKVRKFRRQRGIPVCFTLDAGPNIHVLYPDNCTQEVRNFIEKEIREKKHYPLIHDRVGEGPQNDQS